MPQITPLQTPFTQHISQSPLVSPQQVQPVFQSPTQPLFPVQPLYDPISPVHSAQVIPQQAQPVFQSPNQSLLQQAQPAFQIPNLLFPMQQQPLNNPIPASQKSPRQDSVQQQPYIPQSVQTPVTPAQQYVPQVQEKHEKLASTFGKYWTGNNIE